MGIEDLAERMLVIVACVCTSERPLIGPDDSVGADPLNNCCVVPDFRDADVVG